MAMTDDTQVIDAAGTRFERIRVADVLPDPDQPRKVFDAAKLQELARSIHQLGQQEPVKVRPIPGAPTYMLIFGERRWRALTLLAEGKVKGIPANAELTIDALVVDQQGVTAQTVLQQLVENLHREDLDPIEEAGAIARLLSDEFGLKGKDVAEKIGRNPGHITNRLKLLELPPVAQKAVTAGTLGIDEGLELAAKYSDHPDVVAQAVKERDPVWSARQMLNRKLADQKAATAIAGLKKSGVEMQKTTDRERHAPKGWARIITNEYSAGRGSLLLTDAGEKAHTKEPCRGVLVITSQHRAPELVECCKEPARHGAKGESTVKASKKDKSSGKLSDKEKADRAKTIATNKARREDSANRLEFLTTHIAGKVPAGAMSLVLRAFVERFMHGSTNTEIHPFVFACRVVGLDVGTKEIRWSIPDALAKQAQAYIDQSDQHMLRFALAIIAGRQHEHVNGGPGRCLGGKDGALHLLLDAHGYEFSDQERIDLGLGREPRKAPAKKAPARKTTAKKAPAAKKVMS